MNVLITGGLGHIGSYLIRMLPEEFNITVVDNLLTHRYCSLFDLNRNIKFYDMSVSEFNNLENIDTVIHLAAIKLLIAFLFRHSAGINLIPQLITKKAILSLVLFIVIYSINPFVKALVSLWVIIV